MFGEDIIEISKSSCLVISKVNDREQFEEDLIGQLKEIAKWNSYLPENSVRRKFLDSLIDSQKIYFFSIPKQLTPEKITAIEKSIISLPSFKLRKCLNFSPSEESKQLLQEMISEVCNQLNKKCKAIETKIKGKYTRTYWQLQEAESCKLKLSTLSFMMLGITSWK